MQRLAAYIPMDRRQALGRGEALPDRTSGAALLADLTGFTPLAHAFARELGGKRGAEALLDVINPVFAAIIGPVHQRGGSVINFCGDAITCWFDNARGQAPLQAVASALAMQQALARFATVHTPQGLEIPLSIQVAVSAGPVRRFLVGDPSILQMDSLAGATMEQAGAAEDHAGSGEVLVNQQVAAELGDRLRVSGWRQDTRSERRFAVVAGLAEAVGVTPWPLGPGSRLSPEQVKPWFPAAIYEQIRGGRQVLGDLRPVTPLFIKFGGIDYDGDDDAGQKLDAFVRWVQQVVHRHGGTLLQLTFDAKGSFLYATFGAPVAREDDPVRAMRAALALREIPAELAYIGALQMGLTRGEVWTGTCGGADCYSYGVIGNDVNLSARLMAAAQPGQILVSGRMRDRPEAIVDLDLVHLGDRSYKGFALPVPTYELRGEQLASRRIFSEAMIGREKELERLLHFAQPLLAGRFAGVAIVYGEAGIGKSHLTYALHQELGDRVTWFAGQADQVLHQTLNPFVYWLQRYFGQSPAATADENKARFEARLEHLLGDMKEQQPGTANQDGLALAAELIRTHSILGALLGLHWPDSLYDRLDAQGRHENTLMALKALLLAESRLRPVVLELEDGHWLDPLSHEVLAALSRQVGDSPILIVITSRYADDGSHPAFSLPANIPLLTIDLDVLSRPALARLTEEILEGPVDEKLHALLWEKTQGNPFFAQQMIHYMRGKGLLEGGPEEPWRIQADVFELPGHINSILVARIDRLAQQVKETVQTAAVLGREFQVRVLSEMLQTDALPYVRQAEQEQIWTALQELRYLFKHALLRDAAYEMQLRARLRQLHQLAAEAYEQLYAAALEEHYATLAYHYGQAGTAEKERLYAWLAGEQAAARFAGDEALHFFNRALELTPENELGERYALVLAQEKVYDLMGDREAQGKGLAALEKIARALDDGEQLSAARWTEVTLRQSAYAEAVGNYPAAIQAAQQAIALAQTAGEAEQEAVGERGWGVILWQEGDCPAARGHLERALALAREVRQRNLEADCLCALGCVDWSLGDYAGAGRCYRQSLDLARETGDKKREIVSLQNLGLIGAVLGDAAAAQGHYERSLAIAQEIGYRRGELFALDCLSSALLEQGDYTRARNYAEETLDTSREIGDRREEAKSFTTLGEICRCLGDYGGARAYYEQALELTRPLGDRPTEGITLGNLGLVAHNMGEDEAARQYCLQALQIVKELGDRRTQGYVLTALGHALLGLGQGDEAAAAYRRALDIRRELGEANLVMESLAGLARVEQAAGHDALPEVEEILAYLDGGGSLDGTDEPFRIYLTCYRALASADDARAGAVLDRARVLLQERADKISDEETRRAFLESENRNQESEIRNQIKACQFPAPACNRRPEVGGQRSEIRKPSRDREGAVTRAATVRMLSLYYITWPVHMGLVVTTLVVSVLGQQRLGPVRPDAHELAGVTTEVVTTKPLND